MYANDIPGTFIALSVTPNFKVLTSPQEVMCEIFINIFINLSRNSNTKHIYVSIHEGISCPDLSPVRRQPIIRTNAGLLLIEPLGLVNTIRINMWNTFVCMNSIPLGKALQWRHNGSMASQIISLAIVCAIVCSGRAEIKENTKAPHHWPLFGEFTGDRWIPRTKGQ